MIDATERDLGPAPTLDTALDPLPDPAVDAALADSLARDALHDLVVAKSPGLRAAAYRVRALLRQARAEGALPPPMVGLQIWNLPLTRPYAIDDADMIMLEYRQTLPPSGALDARARARVEEAKAAVAELADAARAARLASDEAFADYRRATQAQAVYTAQLALLARMRRAAVVRVAHGGGIAEVARVDVEVARTRGDGAALPAERDVAAARLNALLARPADGALGDAAAPALPADVGALAGLLAEARQNRGDAVAAAARVRAEKARLRAAQAEADRPEIGIGAGWWQDPHARPGLGLTFEMSLPWLSSGPRERARAQRDTVRAEEAMAAQVALDLQRSVSEAWTTWQSLTRRRTVLEHDVQPAAQRSVKALESAFVAGNATLLEWLDASRALLDVRAQAVDLEADQLRALAQLEFAVGRPLTPPPHPETTP
ncbi:MAG: TolC family protein [Myxococcota bacterium]